MFYDITRTRTIAHDNSIPMFANIVLLNLLVYVLQAGYICIYMSNKSWLMTHSFVRIGLAGRPSSHKYAAAPSLTKTVCNAFFIL